MAFSVTGLSQSPSTDSFTQMDKVQLGRCLLTGKGVERNPELGVKYLKAEADQGNINAQGILGHYYIVSESDEALGVKYLTLAADKGDCISQFYLGSHYLLKGTKQDNETAVKYYKLSADQGDLDAKCSLGNCYSTGTGVIQDDGIAFKYYKQSADEGNANAQYNLGIRYLEGRGAKKDNAMAMKYLQLAADQDHVMALCKIGNCYEEGQGVTQDLSMASKYYKLASDQGDDTAQACLGLLYLEGKGVRQDYAMAIQHFNLSAEQGNEYAQCMLGNCYFEGKGVQKDLALAKKYYLTAAAQGSTRAEAMLLVKFNIQPESFKKALAESPSAKVPARPAPQIFHPQMTLELAFYKDEDDFIHKVLKTEPTHRLPPRPIKKEEIVENYYYDRLMEARKEEKYKEEQIVFLTKLGNILLGKSDLKTAAKYFNGALALILKHKPNSSIQKYILQQLTTVEGNFNLQHGVKNYKETESRIFEFRKKLSEIRAQAKKALDLKEPAETVQQRLTEGFKEVLRNHILSIQKLLGPPPVKWACIGMGSMARGEMCPNSDLEFAFLIDEKSTAAIEYFRKVSNILEMQIINLGETAYPIFQGIDPSHPSPTPSGFSLDGAGNTPLGVKNMYELIGTPEMISQFQSEKWIGHNIILPNALSATCLVAGEEKLFNTYIQAVDKAMATKNKQGTSVRHTLAFELLEGNEGHIQQFKPDLSKDREQAAFGIKKELYRPFQEILGCLSLFFELKERSTFRRIEELEKMKVFSSQGAENLKKAIRNVLTLRLEAHLFYQDETEFLFHLPLQKDVLIQTNDPKDSIRAGLSLGSTKDPGKLYLEEERLKVLAEIYKVLIPFHNCAKAFCKAHSKDAFRNNNFYDESSTTQGIKNAKTFQYAQAQTVFEQAISLNPKDVEAILSLGKIEAKAGKRSEALQRFNNALVILKDDPNPHHPDLALCHTNMGAIYEDLKEDMKALESYQNAHRILINIWGENHPSIATSYQNIGTVYEKLQQYDAAQEYYQKAKTIRLAHYGENHPSVLESFLKIFQLGSKVKPLSPNQGSTSKSLPAPQPSISSTPLPKTIEAKPALSSTPAIAFGIEHWISFFGDVGAVPPLPENIGEILKSPCPFWAGKRVEETHVLVLIPKTINGQLLTLKNLKELVMRPKQGNSTKYRYFFDCDKHADTPVDKPYWVLMTRDILPDSRRTSYDKQVNMIKASAKRAQVKYQVPTLLEASVCIFMEYIRNGVQIYPIRPEPKSEDTFTRCQETKKGKQLQVGKFGQDGLQIDKSNYDLHESGIGAVRRLEITAINNMPASKAPQEPRADKPVPLLPPPSPQVSLQALPDPLPKIAFGKVKWERFFGNIGVEPPLPANIYSILQSPCPFWVGKKVEETHLLVLIPKVIDTWAMSIKKFEEFIKKPREGIAKEYRNYPVHLGKKLAEETIGSSYWILMTKEVIPRTLGKSIKNQKEIYEQAMKNVKTKYRMPKVLEAISSIVTHCLDSQVHLYTTSFTVCEECVEAGIKYHLVVGGFDLKSLAVTRGENDHTENPLVGMAVVRKL